MEQFSRVALDDSSLSLCEHRPSWFPDDHTARMGDYKVVN